MAEKAVALGIPHAHLTRALWLVRQLRIRVLEEGLDPRATRIALMYAEITDRYHAEKRLSKRELIRLSGIAFELFNQTKRSMEVLK